MSLGARLVWKGRRWGISQQIIQEVDERSRSTSSSSSSRSRARSHAGFTRITSTRSDDGTRIVEKIDFDPPGGLLGYVVSTAYAIRKDLEKLLAYREKKLKEIFA